MKIALKIMGLLLLAVGCIWFLQGVNILPGSFMTGQTKWAVIGAGCVVAAIILLLFSQKAKP